VAETSGARSLVRSAELARLRGLDHGPGTVNLAQRLDVSAAAARGVAALLATVGGIFFTHRDLG
jgi:hypothetical protein